MERLTEKGNYSKYVRKSHVTVCDVECKLGEYEQAEEDGLLKMFPVAIGSKVYSPTRNFVSEYTVCSIEIYTEGLFFTWRCERGMYVKMRGFTEYDIGKTVFLTEAEAEQALAKMKGEEV